MIPVEEAIDLILKSCPASVPVSLPITEAYGHTLALDIKADRDYPPFDRACVDGFAVLLSDIQNGIHTYKNSAVVYAGESAKVKHKPGECIKIMTGAAMPKPWNVLFKVEDCSFTGDSVTLPQIHSTKDHIKAGYNIEYKGTISKKGDALAPRGEKAHLKTVSVLAATGQASVKVIKKPSVAIISTGSELVKINEKPGPEQIRDVNYYTLHYGLQALGITPSFYRMVPDKKSALKQALEKVLACDIVILSGGVSMGDSDYVPQILQSLGVKKKFHKVNIKPGKPVWFGMRQKTAVFGLPGNPFSTAVGFKIFVEPFIRKFSGERPAAPLKAPISAGRMIKGDRHEYFPVSLKNSDGKISVEPKPHKGSGDLLAMYNTDGIAFQRVNQKALKAGDHVEYVLW